MEGERLPKLFRLSPMKTIPPPCPEPEVGPKYWRSLDQLAETPEFNEWVEREFPAGASEFTDPVSRRNFVKIMSASFLLMGVAGLTGCRRPEEHILPFTRLPEGYVHGVAQFYATARPSRGSAIPLLVKSNDGRPSKIEGNPQFSGGRGGTDGYTQASILNLYDPDRAMRCARNGNQVSREEAFQELQSVVAQFSANGGQGLSFLLEPSSSPSRARLQAVIAAKFPQATWHSFDPVDLDVHAQIASNAAGQPVMPVFHFDKARRILSLDCDFLGTEQDSFVAIKGFSRGRKIENAGNELNRLYSVEALFTITGGAADHRLPVLPSQVAGVAARVAMEILKGQSPGLQKVADGYKGEEKWITECAKDLLAAGKNALVVAGQRQPEVVHLIAHTINQALGSVGETVTFIPAPAPLKGNLQDLAKTLSSGQTKAVVILGANPAYSAPANLDFAVQLKKASHVVRLGYYEDETFAVTTLHFPEAHFLETWGDGRTGDGTLVSIQPLIEPLFGGISDLEILARIAGMNSFRPYDVVRDTLKGLVPEGDFEASWKKFIHDGVLENSAPKPVAVQISAEKLNNAVAQFAPPQSAGGDQYEIVFHRDYSVDDGRYNNNGWLQETPDPITKIVWENAFLVSPKTAQALSLSLAAGRDPEDYKNNDIGVVKGHDVVELEIGGRKITGPVWIQPGLADQTIALALGYGRTRTGRVGAGAGYNAYLLRTSESPHFAVGAKVTKTGKIVRVVSTQEHGAMEGRPIIREANLEQYRKKTDFARNMDIDAHAPNAGPIYKHPYDSNPELKSKVHQWGMAVDLSSCVGCNACVIACQAENNVPIVGKDQVNRGREMHWLRIDRYFAGDVNRPQIAHQPMMCQHCENAPCESVCPVNATVHDEEGLNIMAYNRCVGTRYCSNNCAWKVRRFNFFDYNKRPNAYAKMDGSLMPGPLYKGPLAKREPLEYDLIKMAKNPDVTVRMRGVMEKCTFCIQRIEGAKISQKVKAGASGDVQVPEGTFTTACAQVCPAEAIVFGNILDENSQVQQLKKRDRNYEVLGFLDTKPRTTYLARIRNPNHAMPDFTESPLTMEEYIKGHNPSPFEAHGSGAHGTSAQPARAPSKGGH